MKILVAAGSRTGSTAYCDILPVSRNLNECMNIEDLILPHNENGNIIYDACTQEFLAYLNDKQYALAWECRPIGNYFYRALDNELQHYLTKDIPTYDQFIDTHSSRWKIINKLDSWCIKIMEYQAVPANILQEIIETVDSLIILKRHDKIAQAISMTKSQTAGIWHNYKGNSVVNFDYEMFESSIHSVIQEDKWLDNTFMQYAPQLLEYEHLDLKLSTIKQNSDNIIIDLERCQQIFDRILPNAHGS